MRTDSLEPEKKAFELILPSKDSFYGTKSLSKNLEIKHGLATALGLFPVSLIGLDVGFHTSVEDLLTICTAIINSIETHGGSFKVEPNSFCNTLQWSHGLTYQW